MAVNTSPEAPLPVGEVSRLIGGWIDRLGAVWEREDLGVVLTDVAVPPVDSQSIDHALAAQIKDATRQVIRAVSQ